MQIHGLLTSLIAALALGTQEVTSSPAPIVGRAQGSAELWVSTAEATAPPAGVPNYYPLNPSRRAQPPTRAHLPGPKDHPFANEQDGQADFNRMADLSRRAPGYQYQAPEIKGVTSALDPNKQSPLNGDNPIAFKSKANSYTPNTRLFDSTKLTTPLPTNRWWLNLIVEQGADPIHPYPYVVKCGANSTTIGFPQFTAAANAYTSTQPADWEISDAQGSLAKRQVTGMDVLGVKVSWLDASGNDKMSARFYKGMPFQTYEMSGIVPELKTIHAIMDIKQLGHTVLSARQHSAEVVRDVSDMPSLSRVSLNDGSQWLITSKPAIAWQQTDGRLTPKDGKAFTGFVQLAHLGDKPDSNINVLQQYAGTYPTEGSVTYAQVQTSGNGERSANVVYFYKTNTDAGGDTSHVYNTRNVSPTMQLLSFMLPHHIDMMDKKSVLSPGLTGYRSVKGPLTAVAGNIISYNQPLDGVSFEGPNKLTDQDRDRLQSQLQKDAANSTKVTAEDPYFFGKGVAKVARLLQIAVELDDETTKTAMSKRIVELLTPWLKDQTNSDPLVYDSAWGGIVSTVGLEDGSADFGQGRYNDHHFHYGYFVYAAAVLANHDPNAFAPLREPINQLLRDYANPSYADKQFTFMRHFDPYDGHSWAAGLFTFGDGRNQESTGEAINAYYAAYLYASALGYKETADFYQIVLSMEATSGRRYWHPTRAQAKELYADPFVHNVVGILWNSKADFATFFGAEPWFMYGIQMLPFTPATRLLLTSEWVKDAWDSSASDNMKAAAAGAGNDGWAQLLYTAYALVDPATAMERAMACQPDDGNTLTNVMHWILTNGKPNGSASATERRRCMASVSAK
ncbi:hypothetical protein GGF46_003800 [Coemansia sp. RSA 552]|nr:hypothetical protein GGF46_003800 [Coemansia sp. RSA 552]